MRYIAVPGDISLRVSTNESGKSLLPEVAYALCSAAVVALSYPHFILDRLEFFNRC
jgi:hypothetical protein